MVPAMEISAAIMKLIVKVARLAVRRQLTALAQLRLGKSIYNFPAALSCARICVALIACISSPKSCCVNV